MKKIAVNWLILICLLFGHDKVVRVYTDSWQELKRISPRYELDIAGAKGGKWYDIIADEALLSKIMASGLSYEVIIQSLAYAKDQIRAQYLSYSEVNDSLLNMAQNYPSICKFDSLPIPTYQGNWIYGVKISDNPHIEEDDEAGFLIDGVHHAREWACIPVVMFFADSLLRAYNINTGITQIINNTEIYCFPIINVDGYIYDYPSYEWWRKNREPFGADTGTDCNRNYAGCSPDIEGEWGAVDEWQASHSPDDAVFCGAYVNSGDETRALTLYAKSHIINAYMSYHSSGELLMWPWSWSGQATPDAAIYSQVGNHMADMAQCLGGGFYDRGPIYSAVYPVSGSSVDWFYSWCHWVGGISNLSFTTELGTMFYQPASDLDFMCHQNFKALKYLADFCDSIVLLLDGVVPAPDIYPLGSVDTNFVVSWHAKNIDDNHPTHWELLELSDPSIVMDDLESGTEHWILDGFTISTSQVHSGNHSFFSGNSYDMNHAVRTFYPYPVEIGDSVTFWCWYDLETNYDVAVVEVSENTKEWFNLDTTRFNGNSNGWIRKAYSLEDWVGRSVYLRFRVMTDDAFLNSGFFVDDIYPVCWFANIDTISSTITDTLYQFNNHLAGAYYYLVRGFSNTWGWGDYSCLKKADVLLGIADSDFDDRQTIMPEVSISPNPSKESIKINFNIRDHGSRKASLEIFDTSGRLVRRYLISNDNYVVWDGADDQGCKLASGVYFIKFKSDDYQRVEKTVLLR